jgi:hypothetical protein
MNVTYESAGQRRNFYGHVSFVLADTAVDICVPWAEFEEAIAIIVTVPAAPDTHLATPLWSIVATLESETDHVPVYGTTNGTGAGDGARLNVPIAVNCTWLLGKVCASAFAGLSVMD